LHRNWHANAIPRYVILRRDPRSSFSDAEKINKVHFMRNVDIDTSLSRIRERRRMVVAINLASSKKGRPVYGPPLY
jgi:hypothetical protein